LVRCISQETAFFDPSGDLSIRTLAMPAKTSVTVHLEAWVLRRKEMHSILVTDGNSTYVSIDDQGCPQAIKQDPSPISA
jgi:acyl-CoA thioesterase YciA